MEWYTHPYFTKYEANKLGVVRNKRTKKELKVMYSDRYSNAVISVYNLENKTRQKYLGSFILECVNGVDKVPYFIHIDGNKENHNYYNLKQSKPIPKGKRVFQISPTGYVVKVWDNSRQAERQEGFNHQCICMCCTGKAKKHLGYYWCYESNINTFKVDVLVASKDDELNYFESTKQAYSILKKKKLVHKSLESFRTHLFKYKGKDKYLYGYKWSVVEKEVNWG